jgi:peptidyl-prolyl cis-trans isomerase C
MKRTKILGLLFTALFISNTGFASDRVVAKYNGQDIMKSDVMARLRTPSGDLPDGKSDLDDYSPEVKQMLINEFIQDKSLLTAADNAKIDADPTYKNLMKQSKIMAYLEKYTRNRVTPAMVRDAYTKYVKEVEAHDELKISHILVKTEAEANKVAAELESKKITFEDAAKQYSIDHASQVRGGELGYLQPGQTVPEFEAAAQKTKKGAISAPVKTQFGWHIIKVLDSRKMKAPAFEEIKPDITKGIKSGLVRKHVGELVQNAKVELVK